MKKKETVPFQRKSPAFGPSLSWKKTTNENDAYQKFNTTGQLNVAILGPSLEKDRIVLSDADFNLID